MSENNKELFQDPGVSRREFVAGSAAALALAQSLGAKNSGRRRSRTLFFNLSHLPSVDGNHRLFIAGKIYEMERLGSRHPLLTQARRNNTFIRALPTAAVTHAVRAVEVPTDTVATGYAITPLSGGEWEMPSIYMHIPQEGFQAAYRQLSAARPFGQPLPASAKRMKYGLPPAANLQEFLDEQVLLDTTNMAAAVVNLHPELLSVVPASAALIQTQFISPRTVFGISNYLETAGPAQPQSTAQAQNSSGWATLVPYTDENDQPLINTTGANKGLILYDAQWSTDLKTVAAPALNSALRGAKNYVPPSNSGNQIALGVDATPGRANIPDSALLGTIWTRRDGQTSIDQSPGTPNSLLSASSVQYTLTNDSLGYAGYTASLPATSSTTINLSFVNSYLRYLGVFAQFYKGDQVVPASQIPSGISNLSSLDTENSVFLGMLLPEFTIFGIPVQTATLNVNFEFPTKDATSAAILASGLGAGSHTFPDTEALGVVMTTIFNYAIPTVMIALGIAGNIDDFMKLAVIPFIQTTFNLMVSVIADLNGVRDSPQKIALALIKALAKSEASPALGAFVTKVVLPSFARYEVIDSIEDAIPIAGEIMQAISIAGALAEITETTIEVGTSPWSYKYQLVGTHDLDVKISPEGNQQFPAAAASCAVTAIFNNGAPQVQKFAVPSSPGASLTTTFRAVPLGGTVTIHVGLYTVDGTQVGHGNAGPIVNDDSAAPEITITQDLLPINASTQYHHKQKTSLDAQGNHVWVCQHTPPSVVAPVGFCEDQPGDICALRGITVSSASNNVGYAWQSYSTASCTAGGSGQLDQCANIPTQNDGSGSAQSGYAFIPCTLTPGTHLIYDPSSRADSNFYLDPSSNILRQIQLNPPAFADPRVNPQTQAAWGKLNLPSADLLLHPAGTIVSINSANHKLESLKLPANPVTDDQASVNLLASVYSGLGSRPGLLDTPTVVTVTAEGTVLVVEGGNNRIHAMDIYGNPVQLFTKQPIPYFLNFSAIGGADTQYLDIAAEFTGFIYVLSSSTSDQVTYQYRLDIYAADQTGTQPISTTMGFNAAKVAVDYWRNVYSLNYEVLRLPNQQFPNGITEPSISQWLPTEPPPCSVGGTPPPRRRHPRKRYDSRLLRRRDLFGIS